MFDQFCGKTISSLKKQKGSKICCHSNKGYPLQGTLKIMILRKYYAGFGLIQFKGIVWSLYNLIKCFIKFQCNELYNRSSCDLVSKNVTLFKTTEQHSGTKYVWLFIVKEGKAEDKSQMFKEMRNGLALFWIISTRFREVLNLVHLNIPFTPNYILLSDITYNRRTAIKYFHWTVSY